MKIGTKTLVAGGLLLSVMAFSSCSKTSQVAKTDSSTQRPTEDLAAPVTQPIAQWNFDSSWIEAKQKLKAIGHDAVTYTSTANAHAGKAAFWSKDSGYVSYISPGTALPAISSGLTVDFWIYASPTTLGAQSLFALPQTGAFWPNMHVLLDAYNTAQGDTMLVKTMFKDNNPGVTYIEQWQAQGGIPKGYNHWTHIQFSYSGSNSEYTLKVNNKVYIDHVVLYTNDPTMGGVPCGNILFNNLDGFVIGTFQNIWNPKTFGVRQSWMQPYKGRIDALKIYNTALF